MDGIGNADVVAAVLHEANGPFTIEALSIDQPRAGEVLVRIVATGMCHTDAAVRSRDLPTPLPVVLGHEGAGVVEAVGVGVTKVAPGDHVVITVNSCGQCDQCLSGHPSICDAIFALNFAGARLDGSHALCGHDGLNDQFFGQSSFATRSIAQERNVIKVTKDVPLELLGPLACGIQTGAGSVISGLKVKAGESFVVFGSGAVGLSAVMGAHVCGAAIIIAVDINPSRLELARELGATHVINGREEDVVARIMEITGKGIQHSLDTTGNLGVIQNGIDCLRPGGVCGILGASPPGATLALPVGPFMSASKTLRGIVEGDVVPEIFIPQMIALYQQGRFPFDKLIKFYELDQINQALEDSEKGVTVKPVVRMPA